MSNDTTGHGGSGHWINFQNTAPGGAYNNAGASPAAEPLAGAGGGGGGANAAGGAGSVDEFSTGVGGAGGAAGTNGSAGGAGGAASGDAGGGGGGGGGTALSSNIYTTNSNLTGGAGGVGGDGSTTTGNSSGGGGGGGGEGGGGDYITGAASLALGTGVVHGGHGGAGGAGYGPGYGGDGGTGGFGFAFVYTGGATSLSVASGGQVIGGAGGTGGGFHTFAAEGGAGGAGGVGIYAYDNFTLTNAGTISGGAGGLTGNGNQMPPYGAGGGGVEGNDLTITNTGTISGGLSGDGGTRADAISFTGGANVLNLSTGTLNGGIGLSGTLSINPNDGALATATLSNVVHDAEGGAGALTYAGAGTLTLTGADTYTGATTIASGTLALAGGGSVANSSVADATTLDISGVTSGGAIGSLSGAGAVTLGSETLTLTNAADTFSGLISGSGGLTISGGTETLSSANTYSGGTTITGGATLSVDHTDGTAAAYANAVGAGTITLDGGGTLLNGADNAQGVDFTNAISVGAGGGVISDNGGHTGVELDGAISGTGQLTLTNGNFVTGGVAGSFSGTTLITGDSILLAGNGSLAHASDFLVDLGATLRLNGNSFNTIGSLADGPNGGGQVYDASQGGNPATLTLGDATSTTFSGQIEDSGGNPDGVLSLIKVGSGTFTESGDNLYSGGTTISAGEVAATTTSALGSGAVTFDGGKLGIGADGLTFDNAAHINATAGSNGFYLNGDTVTWDGVISNGSGAATALAVEGSGTLVLGGANTFTGGLNIQDATVQFDNANELGGGPIALTASSLSSTSAGATITNDIQIINYGYVSGTSVTLSGALTGTGQFDLQEGDSITLTHADAGFSGETFFASNGTTGATLIAGGTDVFGANSYFETDGESVINLNGHSQIIGALDDGESTSIVENTGASAVTLTLGSVGGGNYFGVIEDGGAGSLAIVKEGSSLFREYGANTYSGGTTINAGTLELAHATVGTFGAITSGAAGTGAIAFGGGAAKLQIDSVALGGDASHTFAYAINGFTSGETIEVKDGVGSVDTATYDAGAGALTLTNGGTTEAILHIGAGYGGDTFTTALDGNNGTDIMVSGPAAAPSPPSGGGDGGAASPPVGPSGAQTGSSGDDTLTAGSGPSTVSGGAGDDHIDGGTGSSALYGNAGNDTITLFSYTGASTVYGGQGDDHIDASGSSQSNFLSGDLGNDSITLGSGADTAYGGAGDDSLVAGSGQDQLYGNAGNDHIALGAASGAATVFAGQGNDVIDASQSTHNDFISADVGDDLVTLGSGADTAYGGDGADTVVAGAGHDQLYGNAGSDYIYLGSANLGSTVYGGQGGDVIDASTSTHANYISGDVGTDIILGGSSSDTIHGGEGSDTIQAAAGATEQIHVGAADSSAMAGAGQSELDHITGFGSGDKLVFDGDAAGTSANTLTHAADASIANFATAYAYAYGDGTHAGALSGAVEYVIVDDSAGHTYVFAADHAAVEIDGLSGGANSVAAGQLLAA